VTDIFEPLTSANPAAKPRLCRRHDWRVADGGGEFPVVWQCSRCNVLRDPVRALRGKRSRNRGNSIEREVGTRMGLRRVGMYGGPEDLSGDLFRVQVKSGVAFPERLWRWLRGVPATAGQTRLLVITDAPGPGYRRRSLVVLELDDWVALHGPEL
jgi:hypothetical protein